MRFALLLVPLAVRAASLTGSLIDPAGASVAHAAVELDSGTKKYQSRTDDAGVYQFADLPAGEYTLKFQAAGFKSLTVKAIGLSEREQKRIPDVGLLLSEFACSGPSRDLRQLPSDLEFGRLTGSVTPPAAEVEVTLICRTFSQCRSTNTDSSGRFSFDMLSPGVYGLSFRRDGFYLENATSYYYHVSAGWESVYSPKLLERCSNGNCDPKLRPVRPCE